MKFKATDRFLSVFEQPVIATVTGQIHAVRDSIEESIERLRRESLENLENRGLEPSSLSSYLNMDVWRKAYQRFGVKAKQHKPTHEALARRLLKGDGWPSINPVVDIYLTNQVAHLLPHGGYDRSSLSGDISLDISPGNEPFVALGGEEELTNEGEVVYRDEERILTRRWNYRDGHHTRIIEEN